MSKLAFVLLANFVVGSSCAQDDGALGNQFESLSWLVGAWDRTDVRPGETASEEWRRVGDSSYVGRGVVVAGEDTVFVEALELRLTDDAIDYIAETPGNAEPVLFRLTTITDTSFISENPAHDFPKRIAYHLNGRYLRAVISGGDQSVQFAFRKREE